MLVITVVATIPTPFYCAKHVLLESPVRRTIWSICHPIATPPIFAEEVTGTFRGTLPVGTTRQGVAKETLGTLSIRHPICVS